MRSTSVLSSLPVSAVVNGASSRPGTAFTRPQSLIMYYRSLTQSLTAVVVLEWSYRSQGLTRRACRNSNRSRRYHTWRSRVVVTVVEVVPVPTRLDVY